MSSSQDLSLVFAAGVFATFNPCGFAMLPAYMTLLVTSSSKRDTPLQLALRALQFAFFMALGVISIFALFAAVIFPISTSIQAYLPIVTITIGILLILLGAATLLGKAPYLKKLWSPNTAPTTRIKNLYLYGVTFALGSVSCTIGPLLAATSKALDLSFIATIKTYVTYAIGISVTIAFIAILALFSQATLRKIRNSMRVIEVISSVFLIAVGLYLMIFGLYETEYAYLTKPFANVITSVFEIQGHVISAVRSMLVALGILE